MCVCAVFFQRFLWLFVVLTLLRRFNCVSFHVPHLHISRDLLRFCLGSVLASKSWSQAKQMPLSCWSQSLRSVGLGVTCEKTHARNPVDTHTYVRMYVWLACVAYKRTKPNQNNKMYDKCCSIIIESNNNNNSSRSSDSRGSGSRRKTTKHRDRKNSRCTTHKNANTRTHTHIHTRGRNWILKEFNLKCKQCSSHTHAHSHTRTLNMPTHCAPTATKWQWNVGVRATTAKWAMHTNNRTLRGGRGTCRDTGSSSNRGREGGRERA